MHKERCILARTKERKATWNKKLKKTRATFAVGQTANRFGGPLHYHARREKERHVRLSSASDASQCYRQEETKEESLAVSFVTPVYVHSPRYVQHLSAEDSTITTTTMSTTSEIGAEGILPQRRQASQQRPQRPQMQQQQHYQTHLFRQNMAHRSNTTKVTTMPTAGNLHRRQRSQHRRHAHDNNSSTRSTCQRSAKES